jgi:hypothetical protein
MIEGQPSHLFIVIGKMHDHFRNAWLNLFYFIDVKLRPGVGWDVGADADDAIHHDIIRTKQRRQKRGFGKPLLRNSNQ